MTTVELRRRPFLRSSAFHVLSAGILLVASPNAVDAHGHHVDPSKIDQSVPIDAMLWMHMVIQFVVWTILFPFGMLLGMSRSRFHVPLQTVSTVLTVGGYILAHSHKGRQFAHTVHGTFASFLIWYIGTQVGLGVYLKMHIMEGTTVRKWAVRAHGVVGKTYPIVGWAQCLFGFITLMGYCMGGKLGQCLAHYIMGSAFCAYAIILTIMMKAGAEWLQRRGCSQEWFDSWVIMLWGIVNTFTEHHGGPWTHKDLQHTLMGVLWWTGGAVGIWLSRGGKRNVFPAIIIIFTGWAMSGHAQALVISTKIHALFGYALMSAGLARIVEVCFVLKDKPTPSAAQAAADQVVQEGAASTSNERKTDDYVSPVRAFQYLPPYLLVVSGITFMSATDEELKYADSLDIDHITYGMMSFSAAFLIFLWFNILIDLYVSWTLYPSSNAASALKLEADEGTAGTSFGRAVAAVRGPAVRGPAARGRGLYSRLRESLSDARESMGAVRLSSAGLSPGFDWTSGVPPSPPDSRGQSGSIVRTRAGEREVLHDASMEMRDLSDPDAEEPDPFGDSEDEDDAARVGGRYSRTLTTAAR